MFHPAFFRAWPCWPFRHFFESLQLFYLNTESVIMRSCILVVVVQGRPTTFRETIGRTWETISVSQNVLKNAGSTYDGGTSEKAFIFTDGPAGHKTLNTLSRFNVVFGYCDHGSRPHTFTFFSRDERICVFKSKANPNIIFQNPMQIRRPNLV